MWVWVSFQPHKVWLDPCHSIYRGYNPSYPFIRPIYRGEITPLIFQKSLLEQEQKEQTTSLHHHATTGWLVLGWIDYGILKERHIQRWVRSLMLPLKFPYQNPKAFQLPPPFRGRNWSWSPWPLLLLPSGEALKRQRQTDLPQTWLHMVQMKGMGRHGDGRNPCLPVIRCEHRVIGTHKNQSWDSAFRLRLEDGDWKMRAWRLSWKLCLQVFQAPPQSDKACVAL